MLSRDEFLEKYRYVLRSICLDGFIIRDGEGADWKWRRMETNCNKIDNTLAKIFEDLTKAPTQPGGPNEGQRNSKPGGDPQRGPQPAPGSKTEA